jgi:predicted component of type VI protein secretion system
MFQYYLLLLTLSQQSQCTKQMSLQYTKDNEKIILIITYSLQFCNKAVKHIKAFMVSYILFTSIQIKHNFIKIKIY